MSQDKGLELLRLLKKAIESPANGSERIKALADFDGLVEVGQGEQAEGASDE